MSTINQWRVYCINEATFVEGFLPEGTNCTVCFNNNTHSITSNSISIIKTISENVAMISTQPPGQTNGNYRSERKKINAAAGPGVITSQTLVFDYDVGILALNVDLNSDNIGDMFEIIVQPITPVGILTHGIEAGLTTIPLPPSVIMYLSNGFQLIFTNHTNGFTTLESEIKKVDTVNNTVTLISPVTTSFNIGDYVGFQIIRFKKWYINTTGHIQLGNYLRTSFFPKNLKVTVSYTNNSNSPKSFVYGSDILF